MIIRRLAEAIRNQDWFVVGIEIMVVVIGIFIGLQVDDWNQDRKNRELEIEYLDRLSAEFDQLIEAEQGRLIWNEIRIGQAEKVLTVLRTKELPKEQEASFGYWIFYLGVINRPRLSWGVVEELRATGNIQLLRDLELRQALTDTENEFLWVDALLEEEAVIARAYRMEFAKLYKVIQRENRDTGQRLILEYDAKHFWEDPKTVNMISRVADFQALSDHMMRENIARLAALSRQIKEIRATLAN